MTDHLPADGLPEDATVVMAMEVSVGSGYIADDGQDAICINVLDTMGDTYTMVLPPYIALLTAGKMAALCARQSQIAGAQHHPQHEGES